MPFFIFLKYFKSYASYTFTRGKNTIILMYVVSKNRRDKRPDRLCKCEIYVELQHSSLVYTLNLCGYRVLPGSYFVIWQVLIGRLGI